MRHKQKACTICILLLCSRHKSILSFASYTERGRAGQHAVQLYARRCVLCGTQKKRVQSAFCCFVEGISRSFPLPRTQNVGEQGSMLYSYVHGDAFCERQESAKVVTTSSGERDVPLFKKIMGDNKKKQQVCVCVCHFAPHLLVVAISYI